jgi:hypothetical protein
MTETREIAETFTMQLVIWIVTTMTRQRKKRLSSLN